MLIWERLTTILGHFNAYGVALERRTRLIEDLGLDSLTITEFLFLLESEFDIKIPDSDLIKENFYMASAVEKYLCQRLDR